MDEHLKTEMIIANVLNHDFTLSESARHRVNRTIELYFPILYNSLFFMANYTRKFKGEFMITSLIYAIEISDYMVIIKTENSIYYLEPINLKEYQRIKKEARDKYKNTLLIKYIDEES